MGDDRASAGARLDAWLDRPWRLLPNRVSRFYRGGALIDQFRAVVGAADGDRPEDWIGSATRTWTPAGSPLSDEGLSRAAIGTSEARILDILERDPAAVAGASGRPDSASRAGPAAAEA